MRLRVMPAKQEKYVTTAEACLIAGTYSGYLWSLVGKKLTPPLRQSPKKVYWLASEIKALAKEKRAISNLLAS